MSGPRRPKHTRDELRVLLIETARAILRDEGLGTGVENLTFKRVFQRVERDTGLRLTNASVIKRVWDNQAEFQDDVLVAVASDEGVSEFEQTMAAVAGVIDAVDLSTEASRWEALREVCRVGGAANMTSLLESTDWPSWIGVWTLSNVVNAPAQRRRIEAALLEGYEGFTAHFEQAYLALAGLLGFRLRAPLTIRQFTMAVSALAEGCALRGRVDLASMSGIERATGVDGAARGVDPARHRHRGAGGAVLRGRPGVRCQCRGSRRGRRARPVPATGWFSSGQPGQGDGRGQQHDAPGHGPEGLLQWLEEQLAVERQHGVVGERDGARHVT